MYIISLEYGQWEDHTSVDIFVETDSNKAMGEYVRILARIKEIAIRVRDTFVYNGELPYRILDASSDPLEQALARVHDDDVTVVLSTMPVGHITTGRVRVSSQWVELFSYPEVDTVPEIDDNDPFTKFEALALPYERQHFGWRIH